MIDESTKTPGFFGAYQYGSANRLQDEDEFPGSSDVDLAVVLTQPDSTLKLGKFLYRDVLLEVSYQSYDQIESPDQILCNYHLAPSLRWANIISDPSGRLTKLQAAVSKDFTRRTWVYARCEHAMSVTLGHLDHVNEAVLFHEQANSWLFGTAGPTHMLLSAALRDPTIRRRYVVVRGLLSDRDDLDFYETLLELQGSAQMSRERVEHHLDAVTRAFDVAKTVVRTPYRFASDISDDARPISIDGSRELIERGFHREAVYWIVVTYSRCLTILNNDAPQETQEMFSCGFRELLGDLGVSSAADLQLRSEQAKRYLRRVWEVAESIIADTPGIED